VADQYDSPDSRVRRHQIERARQILEYITLVRGDAYATPEIQTDYLLAIADLNLTTEPAQQILALSDEEWEAATAEIPLTLDRAMREEIRENTLSTARRRVPSQVMAELSEPAAAVTVELVRALIRPNSVLNQARTDELRERARGEVPAQMANLERNEIIVRAGDITTVDDVEALTQIGLIHDEWNWWVTVRSFLFTLALLAVAGGTLYRLRSRTIRNLQDYSLLVVIVVIWLLVAKFMIVPHDWLPYLYPLAALGMLVAVLLDLRVAVLVILAFGLIANYLAPNNAPLVEPGRRADLGTRRTADGLSVGRAGNCHDQLDRHVGLSCAL
jgi:membrane-associated HD superfamily phosphohydrolase